MSRQACGLVRTAAVELSGLSSKWVWIWVWSQDPADRGREI